MVEGKYIGSVKTPMGVKKGVITLKVNGNTLSGTIEALGKVNFFNNGIVNGNKFSFNGILQIMFGKFEYKADGVVEGDTLKAVVRTSNGAMEIICKRA